MFSLLVCLVSGAGVCAFGMWAFLTGQSSMAEIAGMRKPENIKGPLSVVREWNHEKRESAEQTDFARQVKSLFAEAEK